MSVEVMIAGTQKGGTTSLLRYLGDVDGIVAQESLEFPYFTVDENYSAGFEAAAQRSFPAGQGMRVAKSVGVMYLPWARERLHDHNPDCKVIVCLREPVSRAYSAYWYLRKTGQETIEQFERAIDAESERLRTDFKANHHFAYIDRGRYQEQIDQLMRLFGVANVLVVSSELLRSDPLAVLGSVLSFIGVDTPTVVSPQSANSASAARSPRLARLLHGHESNSALKLVRLASRRFPAAASVARHRLQSINRRAGFVPPPMSAATRRELTDLFADPNSQLRDATGLDFTFVDDAQP